MYSASLTVSDRKNRSVVFLLNIHLGIPKYMQDYVTMIAGE